MIRSLMRSVGFGFAGIAGLAAASAAAQAQAKEPVSVAIISFSPYSAWYIVKEKNLAPTIDLDVKIIEGITEKNAAITSGQVQCMNNTLDSMVAGRSGDLPVKVVAFSNMSYGLDKMIVAEGINNIEDFKGKSFGADFGFLNHMWMLLTLQRAGIDPPPSPTAARRHTRQRLSAGIGWTATGPKPARRASTSTASRSRRPRSGSAARSVASKAALPGPVKRPPTLNGP